MYLNWFVGMFLQQARTVFPVAANIYYQSDPIHM